MAAMPENQTRRFKPDEVMAYASMDDGWRMEIRAPGKLHPAEKYAALVFKKRMDSEQVRKR